MSDCFWLLLISEVVVVLMSIVMVMIIIYLHSNIVNKIDVMEEAIRIMNARE